MLFRSKSRKLNAIIKTGADEIPLTLLARAILDGNNVKIAPIYTFPDSKGKISKYEDISVENCVKSQLSLAGAELAALENAEITIVVNNFQFEQGDLVLGDLVNAFQSNFQIPKTPYFIADINNANGSDNEFASQITDKKLENTNILAYSAYNTSANTIGSALCIALNTYLAKKSGTFNPAAFKHLMAVRFLDDWAYQANIRKAVREGYTDFEEGLKANIAEFQHYEDKISKFLDCKFAAKYFLPWKRSFEIEIELLQM